MYMSMQVFVYFLGLYRKIVSYVLLCSGLGSPTDIAVVREATGIACVSTYLTQCGNQ